MKNRKKRSLKPGKMPAPLGDADGPLLPTGRDDLLLPFYRKEGDRKFEQICVEIAEKEPSIRWAEKKNQRYRRQYGVDVEGFDGDHRPALVLSCKCYEKIKADDLQSWGDDFLGHWDDHWKGKGVQRFVLAVSVELNQDKLQDAIRAEKDRFRPFGVDYECWGTQQLTSKLKHDPQLVMRLFNQAWAEAVCGTHVLSQVAGTVSSPMTSSRLLTVTGDGVAAAVLQELGDAMERRLEDVQRRAREGDGSAIAAFIQEVRQKPVVWEGLSPRVKARLLRTEAVVKIGEGDIQCAQKLVDDADVFHVAADRTVRALFLCRRDGAQRALDFLVAPANGAEHHLRAALLLELNQHEEALKTLGEPLAAEPKAERLRLLATAFALCGDTTSLLSTIGEMDRLCAADFSCKLTAASLRFHLALASGSRLQLGPFPNPIAPTLARQDGRAKLLRSEAIALIDGLISHCDAERKADLEVWKLGCLLVDEARYQDGLQFASDLVKRSNPHPGAIAWALSYGAEVDRKQLSKTLQDLVEHDGSAGQVAALGLLTRIRRGTKAALAIIEKYGPRFTQAEDAALVAMWRRQLSKPAGEASGDRLQGFVQAARKTRKCGPLIAYLATAATSAEDLAAGAEFLAQSGHRIELDPLRQRLLALETSRAIELAIEGAYAKQDYAAIPDLLAAYRQAIDSRELPYRMRLIGSEAGWRRGDLRSALAMLELDSLDLQAADAGLRRARLIAGIGNVEGAAGLLRVHSQKEAIDPLKHLDLAYHVRHVDPDLSRSIVERAAEQKLEGVALTSVLHMAFELGLTKLQDKLLPEFHEQAARGALPGVFALNVRDTIEIMRQQDAEREHRRQVWLRGDAPIHIAFDGDASAILGVYFGVCGAHDTKLPMLVHAANADMAAPIKDISAVKIRLDVTALLIAARFHLLDLLDQMAEVSLPLGAGAAIRELEEAAARDPAMQPLMPALTQLRQHIASRLETNRWKGLPSRLPSGKVEAEISTEFTRSLLDVVGCHAAPNTVCWIEDRCASFASTIGNVPRVDVLSLCRTLDAQGEEGQNRACATRRALSEAGYSFGLWMPEEIVAQLSKITAPAEVMEEPEPLPLIKRGYALEISLFGYLNREKRSAEVAGMPIELRYATRALHLAPRLMPGIWGATDEKIGVILARSRWCWRNLRCEQTEHFPLERRDDTGRRNLRFLSVFELAMAIAIGSWDAAITAGTARRREYLNWVFYEIIEPMASVEEGLESWLTQQISSSFSAYLACGEGLDDEREKRVLQLLVSELVDCFPDPWRQKIRRMNGLDTALGSKVENVVTVGADVMFRAGDFASALTEALKSGAAEVQQIGSSEKARLVKAADRGAAIRVIVEVRSDKLELSDVSFGLASAQAGTQRASAIALAKEIVVPRGEIESFASHLLSIDGAEARMNEVSMARTNSYAAQMQNLREAMHRQKGVDYGLLSPPSPKVLARYLRFDLSAAAQQWRLESELLAKEVGALQAGKRLAATTLKLSNEIKQQFGAAIVAERKKAAGRNRKAPTPLYALLVAQGLDCCGDATAEDRENAIMDLARSCAEEAPLYCALLRWCYRVTGRDPEWQKLDAASRDLLLMVHADIVLGTLIVEGAEPKEAAKIFDASSELQLAVRLDRNRPEAPAPFENSVVLAATLMAAILRDCSDETAKRVSTSGLRSLVALQIEDRWLARPLITGPAESFHDWSWANGDAAAELADKHVLELLPPFDHRDPDILLARLLEQIDKEETAVAAFPYLGMVSLRRREKTSLEAILESAQRHRIDEKVEAFVPAFHVCTRLMMMTLGALEDRNQAISLCSKWGALAAAKFADAPEESQRLLDGENWTGISQLLDSCLAYLFGATDITEETCATLGDCVEAVARAWPAATDTCSGFLVEVADQLEVSKAKTLWFIVQRLRVSKVGTLDSGAQSSTASPLLASASK